MWIYGQTLTFCSSFGTMRLSIRSTVAGIAALCAAPRVRPTHRLHHAHRRAELLDRREPAAGCSGYYETDTDKPCVNMYNVAKCEASSVDTCSVERCLTFTVRHRPGPESRHGQRRQVYRCVREQKILVVNTEQLTGPEPPGEPTTGATSPRTSEALSDRSTARAPEAFWERSLLPTRAVQRVRGRRAHLADDCREYGVARVLSAFGLELPLTHRHPVVPRAFVDR